MCGIVGVVSNKGNVDVDKRRRFFSQGLIADQLRGFHSTGMFGVNSKGESSYLKKAVNGTDFLQMLPVDRYIGAMATKTFMIGHNRHATAGNVNNMNSHPFQHETIIGVHNGTLKNGWKGYLEDGGNFNVDSEALYYDMLMNGYEETLEKLQGAFSLVWYDEEDCKIRFARNEERPMTFTAIENKTGFAFASEPKMLDWLLDRNGIQHGKIHSLKPGDLLEIDIDSPDKYEKKKFKLHKPKPNPKPRTVNNVPQVMGKDQGLADMNLKKGDQINICFLEWQPYIETKKNSRGYLRGYAAPFFQDEVIVHGIPIQDSKDLLENDCIGKVDYSTRWSPSGDKSKDPLIVLEASTVKVFDKENTMVAGPFGEISINTFEEMTKQGCPQCGGNVYREDADKLIWVNGGHEALCATCSDDWKD